jgi:hypothetical protein
MHAVSDGMYVLTSDFCTVLSDLWSLDVIHHSDVASPLAGSPLCSVVVAMAGHD